MYIPHVLTINININRLHSNPNKGTSIVILIREHAASCLFDCAFPGPCIKTVRSLPFPSFTIPHILIARHLHPFYNMVSPHRSKPPGAAGTRKAGRRVEVRTNIPFNKNEVVTRTQIARKLKNRVVTKSTKVVVPIVPSTPSGQADPPPSNQDDPQMSHKEMRKGPSRSAAVRYILPLFYLMN